MYKEYSGDLEQYIKDYKKWADNGLTNCVDDVIKLKQRIKELEVKINAFESYFLVKDIELPF